MEPTYLVALVKKVDESPKREHHVKHQHHRQEPEQACVLPRLRPAVDHPGRHWWRRETSVVGVYHDASERAGEDRDQTRCAS